MTFLKFSLKFREQNPYRKVVVNALNMLKKKCEKHVCFFFFKKIKHV